MAPYLSTVCVMPYDGCTQCTGSINSVSETFQPFFDLDKCCLSIPFRNSPRYIYNRHKVFNTIVLYATLMGNEEKFGTCLPPTGPPHQPGGGVYTRGKKSRRFNATRISVFFCKMSQCFKIRARRPKESVPWPPGKHGTKTQKRRKALVSHATLRVSAKKIIGTPLSRI